MRFTNDHEHNHHFDQPAWGPGAGRGPVRGRGRGFGPGPGGFGGRGWDGDGRGGPGGGPGRMRRGDIRLALLLALDDGPAHGYELIGRLEARTGGAWRPSPGSVYPTLQLLEDEGLVAGADTDGKRTYTRTDAGRDEAEAKVAEAGGVPWERPGFGGEARAEGRQAVVALAEAARQAMATGTAEQRTKVLDLLTDTRKQIYRILAED